MATAEALLSSHEVASKASPNGDEWDWEEDIEGVEPEEPKTRLPILFFVSMAALGVVLAVGWRYSGAAPLAEQMWSEFKSARAAAAVTAPAPTPQAPVQAAEVDALKGEISRLTATNGQLTAQIASLQDQQRELARRAAVPTSTTNLFSDPVLLKLQIVPRALTTGSASRTSAPLPSARTEARQRAAPKSTAPLALAPQDQRP
jgi:hypothetical protein